MVSKLVKSQEEANEALHTLFTDDNEWRRRSLAGIREVFARHTYAHRLNDIFEQLSIKKKLKTNPNVTLIAAINHAQEIEVLDHFINQQTYENFRIIAIASSEALLSSKIGNRKLQVLPTRQIDELMQTNKTEMDFIGLISTSVYYGPDYLKDLVNASLYEPVAAGWAKSIEKDHFCYGQKASMAGAIWQSNMLNEILKLDINSHFSKPNLYVIDSDQFSVFKEMTAN